MTDDLTLFHDEADTLVTLIDPRAYCVCGDIRTLGTIHRTDGPCFRYEPPDQNKIGYWQKASSTSRRGAVDNYPRSGTQRFRVLQALMGVPRTDEELGLYLSMNPSSVRPRRVELVEGGWVKALLDDDGAPVEAKNRSGSMAQVWVATAQARYHKVPS